MKNHDIQTIFNRIVPEIIFLFSFNHENIVKYYEHFATNDFLYLVTEYCDVELFKFLNFFYYLRFLLIKRAEILKII